VRRHTRQKPSHSLSGVSLEKVKTHSHQPAHTRWHVVLLLLHGRAVSGPGSRLGRQACERNLGTTHSMKSSTWILTGCCCCLDLLYSLAGMQGHHQSASTCYSARLPYCFASSCWYSCCLLKLRGFLMFQMRMCVLLLQKSKLPDFLFKFELIKQNFAIRPPRKGQSVVPSALLWQSQTNFSGGT